MATKKTSAKTKPAVTKETVPRAATAKSSASSMATPAKLTPKGWAAVSNPKRTVQQRSAALLGLTSSICENDTAMRGALALIADASAPQPLRLTALRVVQAASFAALKFNAWKPEYLVALRKAAQDDDPELRQRVLGILSREEDKPTQQRLLEGLKDPQKALVAPEKALQLLSYDVHAGAYSAAREIVHNPPNDAAKREALRVLGADAQSAPLFESILRDKTQPADVRQISASALHALAPQKLQESAREIFLDASDNDDVRSTSLTALNHFGAAPVRDEAVEKEAAKLHGESSVSETLKQSAGQYLHNLR